jgi:hypothetical protein
MPLFNHHYHGTPLESLAGSVERLTFHSLECNFPGKAVLHVAHECCKAECLARAHRYYTQRANN